MEIARARKEAAQMENAPGYLRNLPGGGTGRITGFRNGQRFNPSTGTLTAPAPRSRSRGGPRLNPYTGTYQ